MKLSMLIFSASVPILLAACPDPATLSKALPPKLSNATLPKNTESTNVNRRRLSIREIKSEIWYYYGTYSSEETWKESRDGLEIKKIKYNEQMSIEWEEDMYYSGKTIIVDGSTLFEMLFLHYEYGTDTLFVTYNGPDKSISGRVDGFEYVMPSSTERPPRPDKANAIRIADDILKLWGQSRL